VVESVNVLLKVLHRGLVLLGQQGSRALAALVVLGIALPPVGTRLKPFVTEAVFALLSIAFLRLELRSAAGYLRRPGLVLSAIVWTSIIVPSLFGLSASAIGLDVQSPDVYTGLILHGTASPMMAAPAIAALMGLNSTVVLLALIGSSALLPFTAPLFAHTFLGAEFALSPWLLGTRLLFLLVGSAVVGLTARKIIGARFIARNVSEIDGLNILFLFVFVSAVMGGVAGSFLGDPFFVLLLVGFAFLVFGLLLGCTALLFARAGKDDALAVGFMTSQRNLGLMIAASGSVLPETTWLYFALSQFPIYLSPVVLQLILKRPTGSADRCLAPSPCESGKENL
jgi:BASS family bile acid:Na+ symporter